MVRRGAWDGTRWDRTGQDLTGHFVLVVCGCWVRRSLCCGLCWERVRRGAKHWSGSTTGPGALLVAQSSPVLSSTVQCTPQFAVFGLHCWDVRAGSKRHNRPRGRTKFGLGLGWVVSGILGYVTGFFLPLIPPHPHPSIVHPSSSFFTTLPSLLSLTNNINNINPSACLPFSGSD